MGGFIWGFTGVEGSGKSCAMTAIALRHCALVAKANGYAYIFDTKILLFYDNGDDITPLVKKELGIK